MLLVRITLSQEDDTTAAFNYAVINYHKQTLNTVTELRLQVLVPVLVLPAHMLERQLHLDYRRVLKIEWKRFFICQSNSHNEASSAAQKFQHSIKVLDKISQAKRLSISTATSEVSDSVATKIIANHNHSHAITIQYWEVMRRYRMETCIDSIDLVLFVPLKTIRFLPENQKYHFNNLNLKNFGKTEFNARYGTLLKYANSLQYALPYQYRTGLNLIKQYASYPMWKMEEIGTDTKQLTLTFKANLLNDIDKLSIYLVLKNGKGTIAGNFDDSKHTTIIKENVYKTTKELRQAIIHERNKRGEKDLSCTFDIPSDIIDDDLAYIKFDYSCREFNYTLSQDDPNFTKAQSLAYNNLMGKQVDLAQDNKGSWGDRQSIEHYKSQLPEAYQNFPYNKTVTFSPSYIMRLGYPIIDTVNLKLNDNSTLDVALSSSQLNNYTRIYIKNKIRTLRYN